ncbi:30S ribosomal protein S17 [Candidatus Roizmanbacteria bacterium RIFOXYB2_FULL_38_10]|uniref:Small ribosomal subunit protein uS17 n=1 Tax=Candidatus Roizmanbacteria bacterium RIFOXYD1_FULL_38_12 TaxID=1802093 RepID=A0A1F7L010_9BACT|nr:MAG: 30S ribosomal protein S17 [Candidatus Roizmanbacteria bacterium RIFOXYA2_FULL_38_14]OGK63393.1 MAG: 30S ribosomal protein S17 [Candidatus Roizmanbacteria bacterium RIFOXYA1_FULL_37_12]OGK65239.1 MAG: 30S ribosomal protein S17 [Candidatus Roizmanbacteria bacterium RIFOXYB1_FULL_40_23]OGK68792.1 MAG: 30S ribosomal protein S17 [Candidatus Roizmanbacteria bacterium RIFOXYB2_FULL_38_10]OGK69644.1 MAG: 30S ribosomal protein S17 [Candidatus Roizmanbacteria bacterium RIFOXYC1_FULL_38_14]OGK727
MTKTLSGKIVSSKMKKTVVVSVERKFRHPKYHKVIIRHKKYKAHNEIEGLKEADYVKIQETKPMSKEKRFIVIEKLKQKPN